MATVHIFVSYSHENDRWIHEGDHKLIPWLNQSLKRQDVQFWYDQELRKLPGEAYRQRIEQEIDNAHIAVLLISQNFANSDFVREVELPRIKARYERNELWIIPILVGPVDLEEEPELQWISDRQIIPGKPTPLINYINDSARWQAVQLEILKAFRNRIGQMQKLERSTRGAPNGSEEENGKEPKSHFGLPDPKAFGFAHRIKRAFSKRTLALAFSVLLVLVCATVFWISTLSPGRGSFGIGANPTQSNLAIIITEPGDRDEVPHICIIKGTVSRKNCEVWVIVNPVGTLEFWVQPETQMAGKEWSGQINIGRPGHIDVGKHFTIKAIVNPKNPLKEGDVFGTWPEAEGESGVIGVMRR